jgi:molybdopterin synthase catalytic subunit
MQRLTEYPIDFTATESVRSTDSGAVVLFLGTVREMTDGRRTTALDYEAFGPMAESKLAEIETEARQQWPLDRVAIVHRVGRLELGEVSVAVAVSSPHRTEAFEAARFIIDTLKETVPIWKKENWHDGTSEWVHPGVESAMDLESNVPESNPLADEPPDFGLRRAQSSRELSGDVPPTLREATP